MSSGIRRPLREAIVQARALVGALDPYCLRIEIAGSIRRQKAEVGDVEIVLLPRTAQAPRRGQDSLLEEPQVDSVSLAWQELDRLTAAGRLPAPSKGGDRYRCYPASETTLQVDVFQVSDERAWGPLLAVRTGPAEWSRWAVTCLRRRGLRLQDGLVWSGDVVVPCPEELAFFAACGLDWALPRDRK